MPWIHNNGKLQYFPKQKPSTFFYVAYSQEPKLYIIDDVTTGTREVKPFKVGP
jgi:hypothetical protein